MSDDEKPVYHRQPSPHVDNGPPPYPQRVHIPQISSEPSTINSAVTRELTVNPVTLNPYLIPFPHMQSTVPYRGPVAEINLAQPSLPNTNTQGLETIRLWDLSSSGVTRSHLATDTSRDSTRFNPWLHSSSIASRSEEQVPSDLPYSPAVRQFDRIPYIQPAVQMNLQVQQQVRMMQDTSHTRSYYQTPNMFYRLENQERESNNLRCSNNDYLFSQLVLMDNRERGLTTHPFTSLSTNDGPFPRGHLPLQPRVVRPQAVRTYIPHHRGTNGFPIQGRTREISNLQYSFPSQSSNFYSFYERNPVQFYPQLYSILNRQPDRPISSAASYNQSESLTNFPHRDNRTSQSISIVSQPQRNSAQISVPSGCVQPHHQFNNRPWDLSTSRSLILPQTTETNHYSVRLNPRPHSFLLVPESDQQISSNNLATHSDPTPASEEIHENFCTTQSQSAKKTNSKCHQESHIMENKNDSIPNSNTSHYFSVTRAPYPPISPLENQQSGLLGQIDEPPHTSLGNDFQNVVVTTFSDLQGNYSDLMISIFGFLCSFLHRQIESTLGSDSSSPSQETTSSQEEETMSQHPSGLTEDDAILVHLQECINNSLQTLHSLSANVSRLRTQQTLVSQDHNIASQSTQSSPQQDTYTSNKDSSNPGLLSEEQSCLSSNAHSVPAQTDSNTNNNLSTLRHVSLFPASSSTQPNVQISQTTASHHQSNVPTTEKSSQTETTVSVTFPSSNTVFQVPSAVNTTSESTLPSHEPSTMVEEHIIFICISVSADIHENVNVSTNVYNNSLSTQNRSHAETNVVYSCTPKCLYHKRHTPSSSNAAVTSSSGISHLKRPLENSSSQIPTKKMRPEAHLPNQATMTNSPNVLKQPNTQSNSHKITPIFSAEPLCLRRSNSISPDNDYRAHQHHSHVSNEPQLSSQQCSNTHHHHHHLLAGLPTQTSSLHQNNRQQLQSNVKYFGNSGPTIDDHNYSLCSSLGRASLPVKTDSSHSEIECKERLQQFPDDQIVPCSSKENSSTQTLSSSQPPAQSKLSPILPVSLKTEKAEPQSDPVKQEPIQDDQPLNLSTRETNLSDVAASPTERQQKQLSLTNFFSVSSKAKNGQSSSSSNDSK